MDILASAKLSQIVVYGMTGVMHPATFTCTPTDVSIVLIYQQAYLPRRAHYQHRDTVASYS